MWTYLPVNEDDGAKQPPGAALPVHVQHAQDLQEADAADGRRGEHLAVGAHRQHHDGGHHHDQVWKPSSVFRQGLATAGVTLTAPFSAPLPSRLLQDSDETA